MTASEAIKDIQRQLMEINSEEPDITLSTESLKMAIRALEMRIPKQPTTHMEYSARCVKCPTCRNVIYHPDWYADTMRKYHNDICVCCGQKLTKPSRYLGHWEEAEQALADMQKG